MPVYVTLVELKPREGCELEPSEFAGAMTRGYVAADGIKEAIARFESAVELLKFDLVEMEWCGRAEAVDWEDADDESGSDLAAEAEQTGQVVFGKFAAWNHDAAE